MSLGIFSTQLLPINKTLKYGGVELFLYYFCEELGRRGIDYTLYAPKGSVAKGGSLVETFEAPGKIGTEEEIKAFHLVRDQLEEGHTLINDHSHGGMCYLLPERIKILKTFHGLSTWSSVPRRHPNVVVLSDYHRSMTRVLPGCDSRIIGTGVSVDDYEYNDSPDEYYLHLGLMSRHKGALLSVQTCKKLGLKLKVAGEDKFVHEDERKYVEKVKDACDGKDIEYLGPVDIATKHKLLANAKATLLPFLQYEVYSLILIESLLHGTPVVTMPIGAIPEMVDGTVAYMPKILDADTKEETSFTADMGRNRRDAMLDATSWYEFPKAVEKIERRRCRLYAEERYSIVRCVDSYLALFEKVRGGETW